MEGIIMALDSSEEKIIVETDCMELVSIAKNPERDSSCFGHMVADLQELLTSRQIVAFNKIPREQNSANHELARFGMLQDRTELRVGMAPEALLSRILRDWNDIII
jgi:hypothetical protein